MNIIDFFIVGAYFIECMVFFLFAHHRLAYILILDSLCNIKYYYSYREMEIYEKTYKNSYFIYNVMVYMKMVY